MRLNDPREYGRVALVIGGQSAEREVSLDGGRAIAQALGRLGISYTVYDGPGALLAAIHANEVDRVFNLLHGPCGEDGTLQGALELLGIPFTGSGVLGSALTMDKPRSKWIWQRHGLKTPEFMILGPQDSDFEKVYQRFSGPLFVKPVAQGSSVGISRVTEPEELASAVALARKYNRRVIVEPEVTGDEYFAGMVGEQNLPLIRISTPNAFFDYEAKYESDETEYHCPCGLDAGTEAAIQKIARQAYELVAASGWGRVDFILDSEGEPNFLEVNTTPGMTDHGLVPKAAAQMGIGFDELVEKILAGTLENMS